MAVSAAVRSTSAFGWKGDPQICAILQGIRRPEIGGDDSGYSRFSPEADLHAPSSFPGGGRLCARGDLAFRLFRRAYPGADPADLGPPRLSRRPGAMRDA